MFLGIFVLNRVSILSFFVVIRVSIFVLNRVSFLDDKQPVRMFYELNYSKFCFGFGLNRVLKSEFCLKQGRKISDFVLNRVRV